MGQRIDWVRPSGDSDLVDPVVRFRILRSIGEYGSYKPVAEIPAKDVRDDWVLTYEDRSSKDFPLSWYQVEYITKGGQVAALSMRMRGQTTRASVLQMMYQLRSRIGDTRPPYCLQDWELLDIIHESLKIHNRYATFDSLPEEETYLVIWVAIHSLCKMLATDNAKFFPLSVDGANVDKSQRYQHYIDLANQYWDRYQQKRDEWNADADKSGYVKDGFVTRESLTTGRRVPAGQVLAPKPVILYPPERVTAGSVTLRWSRSFDATFYYYILFRSEAPNIQKSIIEDAYHKRVVLFDDPGDLTNGPLRGGITTPLRMFFRNSIEMWVDTNSGLLSQPNFQGPIPLLLPGHTYYYVMGVVNKSVLLGLSNEICVPLAELGPPQILARPNETEKRVVGLGEPDATVELFRRRPPAPTFTSMGSVQALTGTAPSFAFQDIDIIENDELKANQKFLDVTSDFSDILTVTKA